MTASHSPANASECPELDSRFSSQPKAADPVARGGRGRYLGGYRCGKVIRKPPLGSFLRFLYGEKLRTTAIPRQAKQIPKESGRRAIQGTEEGAGTQGSRQTRKEASPEKRRITCFRSQGRGGFTTPDPPQKGNPTAFPGVVKTVNSFRPALDLCVCVSFSLSPQLVFFKPLLLPRDFLHHPLPPLHRLQSRSKYFFKNFTNPQLKELLGFGF